MVGAIICGIIAMAFFIIGFMQLMQKGFLFNNAYIFASEEERKSMNKKPYYKQSAVVFLLIGIIFAINAIEILLELYKLFPLVIIIAATAVIYAIISTVKIEKKK